MLSVHLHATVDEQYCLELYMHVPWSAYRCKKTIGRRKEGVFSSEHNGLVQEVEPPDLQKHRGVGVASNLVLLYPVLLKTKSCFAAYLSALETESTRHHQVSWSLPEFRDSDTHYDHFLEQALSTDGQQVFLALLLIAHILPCTQDK
ncbi:unnamed protein product [Sphenostylis stenocarpa]|uniref:Uncharacterized protein n=1 Tax=Sphenostylis stenocarpa TaxID=92480 RepID=A0AA86S3N7_9FABA|nr:unnamed protein product [Sphenostylis stenocarpa]